MKKVLLLIAVAAITLPSCKKNYTCTCTRVSGTNGSTTTSTQTYPIKAKKADAKKSCDLLTSDDSTTGYTDKTTCVIN